MLALSKSIVLSQIRTMIGTPKVQKMNNLLAKNQIICDVIQWPNIEPKKAEMVYMSGARVHLGNELTPTQTQHLPKVEWEANAKSHYVLCMTDPDVPSREEPHDKEWLHWLVGNIPGKNIVRGESLAEYIGPLPCYETKLHRYVLLIYEQPERMCFVGPRLKSNSCKFRSGFSICQFARKYNLGEPVAINFFQAGYDEHVPKGMRRIGMRKMYIDD